MSNQVTIPCYRGKLTWPEEADVGTSKNDPIGFAVGPNFADVCRITHYHTKRWTKAYKLTDAQRSEWSGIDRCYLEYAVDVGYGDYETSKPHECFLFGKRPANAPQDESHWLRILLANVKRVLKSEDAKQAEAAAAARQNQLTERPAKMSHEEPTIDHYRNRQQVIESLLRKKWPLLSEAMKTGDGKKTWIAFIADYKRILGKMPDVPTQEAAGLWKDDDYLRVMNQAMNGNSALIDRRDWHLAIGWIEKNYYRMTERELEHSFNAEYAATLGKHKGNTLAKRARNIGLKSALKLGRPEKPNAFDK